MMLRTLVVAYPQLPVKPVVCQVYINSWLAPSRLGFQGEFQALGVSYHSWLTLTSGETGADGVLKRGAADGYRRCLLPFSHGSHPLGSPSLEFPLLLEDAIVVWLASVKRSSRKNVVFGFIV